MHSRNIRLVLLVLALASGCPRREPPPDAARELRAFRSGFEATTALSGAQLSPGNTWIETLDGRDEETGFSWPDDLPGNSANASFFYLVAGNHDIASIVETRIDDVTGPFGTTTRALYQSVLQDHQSTASRARNMYAVPNDASDAFREGTVRYWLMLQPDLVEVLPPGGWRQVIEWRESGDAYRKAILILPDAATGEIYWDVHGDFGGDLGWDRDWTIENRAISVPVGEWFLLEVYWREGVSDGRMLVRIDCQVLADHVGRTSAGGRIDHLHLFKVYAAAESLAVGPSYQWIDNVELDPTLTSAECP